MHGCEKAVKYAVGKVLHALAGRIAEGQPRDGCAPLHSSGATQGGIILLERGQCMFAAKVCPACWVATCTCLSACQEGPLI